MSARPRGRRTRWRAGSNDAPCSSATTSTCEKPSRPRSPCRSAGSTTMRASTSPQPSSTGSVTGERTVPIARTVCSNPCMASSRGTRTSCAPPPAARSAVVESPRALDLVEPIRPSRARARAARSRRASARRAGSDAGRGSASGLAQTARSPTRRAASTSCSGWSPTCTASCGPTPASASARWNIAGSGLARPTLSADSTMSNRRPAPMRARLALPLLSAASV